MGDEGARDRSLFVCRRGTDLTDVSADDVFVVEDELQRVDDDVADRVYAALSQAEPLDLSTPIYRTSWRHIVAPENVGLQESVMLYMRLREVIDDRDPDRIEYQEGLRSRHVRVIRDLASAEGLDVRGPSDFTPSSAHALWRFLKNSMLVLPFLLDQVLALIWTTASRAPRDAEMAFVPSLGRLNSTLPVLERLVDVGYDDHDVVVTSKVSAQVRRWTWTHRRSALYDHDLVALSSYTDLRCLMRQISSYLSVSRAVLFGDDLESGLDDLLRSEFDVDLDRTLTFTVLEAFRTRVFLSIFFYHLTDRMVSTVGSETVVIGGLSPSRRAIMLASMERDAEVYYVPHNIGSGGTPNPPSDLTHFVSGKLEARRYTESTQVTEPWNWVVTGRPYLVDIHEDHSRQDPGGADQNDGPLRLLVATQGFSCRREFVDAVVGNLDAIEDTVEVVIKIHPSEEKGTYADYAENDRRIHIAESGLVSHIDDADLTLTINSNVGLESVIMGTPAVSVDKWRPTIPEPIYAMYGPIPVLSSDSDIRRIFGNLDAAHLDEMRASQTGFVRENYALDADATANIVDHLVT